MGLLLALIIICGVFSAVPFAAEAEHTAVDPEDGTYTPGQVIVMFKDGAVTTDTAPEKGGIVSTGAGFAEAV